MDIYKELETKYEAQRAQLNKRSNLLGLSRLFVAILFVVCCAFALKWSDSSYFLWGMPFVIIFLILVKVHDRVSKRKQLAEKLVEINNNERTFLEGERIPFEDGSSYIDTKHFYAYDLDVFGPNSLFQFLNRTATFIGREKLSSLLLTRLPNEDIRLNQAAIQELSTEVDWRQHTLALSIIVNDGKENYQKLIDWSTAPPSKISKPLSAVFYLFPALFLVNAIILLFNYAAPYTYSCALLFGINLAIAASQTKKIKQEMVAADKIANIIKYYGLILEKIEQKQFNSEKLKQYQSHLVVNNIPASKALQKLSDLFASMDSNNNVVGALLFNGSLLYSAHTLKSLLKWKKKYSNKLKGWLDIIGEFEALNSLANFSYNNPSFIYPALNEAFQLEFKDLGHPLIEEDTRVCNDVQLTSNNFTILTGSNMSGKSTFLRTLGINMVLSGIGSSICATQASVHPMTSLVSLIN